MVKLQESPDDMPPGQTPHTIVVYAHGDLVTRLYDWVIHRLPTSKHVSL